MWLLNGSHGGCEQLIGQFGVASSSSRASEIITQRLANEGRSSVLCREREKTKDIWIQDFYMFISCKRMGSRITRHFQLSIWKSIFKWVNVQLLCMYQKTQLKKKLGVFLVLVIHVCVVVYFHNNDWHIIPGQRGALTSPLVNHC